jgi:crossover junction endodeoxyribonuclease RusA
MKQSISLTLPYPPSVNEMYANANKGRRLTKKGRDFKTAVKRLIVAKKIKANFAGELLLEIAIYRPRTSGDLDNRIKAVQDALQKLVYSNDSQIVELHAFRFDDKTNPRAEVRVVEL